MNFEIVELDQLSGPESCIYSIILENDTLTLFDCFINENIEEHKKEIESIVYKLEKIGFESGAREGFFKINEGKPGDGVCALYDYPDSNLRLFCIRYGSVAIILGGGGKKVKTVRSWQENNKLKVEAERMIKISELISEAIRLKKIKWSPDGSQLLGNLKLSENE